MMEGLEVKLKEEQPDAGEESFQFELPDLDTNNWDKNAAVLQESLNYATCIKVKVEPCEWSEDTLTTEESRNSDSKSAVDVSSEIHFQEELGLVKTFDYDVIKTEVHDSVSVREDSEESFSFGTSSSEDNDDPDDVTWGDTGNASRKRKISKNTKRQSGKKKKSWSNSEILRPDICIETRHEKSAQTRTQANEQTKQYGCEYCDEVFIVKSELIKHKKKHAREVLTKHQKKQLRLSKSEHSETINNEKDSVDSESTEEHKGNNDAGNTESEIVLTINSLDKEGNKCRICDKLLISKFHLDKHMKTHNPEGRNFKCDICPSYFKDKHDLNHHINSHSNLKPFKCKHCEKSFSRSYILNKHVERSHTEIAKRNSASISCEICDVVFCKIGNLQRHQANVHGGVAEEKYKCGHCDQAFRRIDLLKKHINRKHNIGKVFACDFCAKTFPCQEYVGMHIDRVHKNANGEIQTFCYKCDECQKRFKDEGLLSRHFERHHKGNLTKYPCTQCERYFLSEELLRDHEAKHNGVKRHKCKLCGSRYTARSSLSIHMKNAHQEYVTPLPSRQQISKKQNGEGTQ